MYNMPYACPDWMALTVENTGRCETKEILHTGHGCLVEHGTGDGGGEE